MKSDIYLAANHVISPGSGRVDRIDDPQKDKHDSLYDACEKQHAKTNQNSFAMQDGDIRMRVSVVNGIEGKVFVLRKFAHAIREVNELKLPSHYTNTLLTADMTGLVLVAGPTHSGKTTACSSIIASRLKTFGGVAITIEDPCEMPLNGSHGKGVCYQTDASNSGGFSNALRDVVRTSPDIIFLGEIRDSDTAIEAIKAAINGHLIFATIHADDVVSALLRLRSLASQVNPDSIDQVLAQGIGAILHMKLESKLGQIAPVAEFISFIGDENQGFRNAIEDGKHKQLSSAISYHKNKARSY